MSWVDIENVIQRVIVWNSGFTNDRVVWSYQNFNEPDEDYVVINFGGSRPVGIDRIATTQDLTRANGQEIKQEIKGVREVPFEFQVVSADTSGSAAARQLAEQIRTKFRLETIQHELRKGQISVFDASDPVQWVPEINGANFRGRAICTVRCYVPVLDCYEYTGYIARVRGLIVPVGWTAPSGSSGWAFDSLQGSGMSGFGS